MEIYNSNSKIKGSPIGGIFANSELCQATFGWIGINEREGAC